MLRNEQENSYDSAGRMTSLSTQYGAPSAASETRWAFDPATGLVANKLYADGSSVGYTYTPDGKPLRTTYARGTWKENTYTASGLLAGISYGGGSAALDDTPPVSYAYDAVQYLVTASNSVAHYTYANTHLGITTNETVSIGTDTHTLDRHYDEYNRPAGLSINGNRSVSYSYNSENRLAGVSNANFALTYRYSDDGCNMGYTVMTDSGTTISRTLTRSSPYLRNRISAVSNTVRPGDATSTTTVSQYTLSYDNLHRVTARSGDTFAYNPRSEIGGHDYDILRWCKSLSKNLDKMRICF